MGYAQTQLPFKDPILPRIAPILCDFHLYTLSVVQSQIFFGYSLPISLKTQCRSDGMMRSSPYKGLTASDFCWTRQRTAS